jgi:two-component system, cell cycle response regulator
MNTQGNLHENRLTAMGPVNLRAGLAPQQHEVVSLRVLAVGFNDMEHKLLGGVVRLSERRKPRLELVSVNDAHNADVVLVDGESREAVKWAESQSWLLSKPAIWIDSKVSRPHALERSRPVQWTSLPILLSLALEKTAPVAPTLARASVPGRAAAVASAGLGKQTVLVVDDSLAVRNHLRSLLEARGLQVSEAVNVREAVTHVLAERYDCVLMDVLMPDLDGYEGCKKLKALKATIGELPVVMLTSKSSPFDRIRGKMAGCDAYLTKPVDPARLYEVLSAQMGSRPDASKANPAGALMRQVYS